MHRGDLPRGRWSAVANLEAHADEINALNVFPVPDGDTGTNMVATVRAALDEARAVPDDAPVERIAAALSFGALMGARGNSGVITSQILRGIAEALAGKRRFNGLDLANALTLGTRTAYGAVGKPVEGTILTVIREASAAAVAAAEGDDRIECVLEATVEGARRAVAKTPSLLPILKEAGVVDSGGQGLPVCSRAPLPRSKDGQSIGRRPPQPQPSRGDGVARAEDVALSCPPSPPASRRSRTRHSATRRSSSCRPTKRRPSTSLRSRRTSILGNSVLVGGDERMVKVHVHNERPDEVIAYGLSLGTLTRITVENLDTMADDVREARATDFVAAHGPLSRTGVAPTSAIASERSMRVTAAGSGVVAEAGLAVGTVKPLAPAVVAPGTGNGAHGPVIGAATTVLPPAAEPAAEADGFGTAPGDDVAVVEPVAGDPTLAPAIVAVVAGDGLEKLFRDLGVELIVRGGQTANPSTGELLRIARLAKARDVIILPNNPNVRLAAELASRLCEDRAVRVVPTRNAAEGVAALLAFDADRDAAANIEPMTAAGRGLATLQVTEAVRDAKIGGKKVRKGQTIALDPDDGLVAVDSNRDRAVLKAVATFPAGIELVTVYLRPGCEPPRGRGDRPPDRGADRCRARGGPRWATALPLPHLGRVGE